MGATSGIGYEVALILASRGWRIGVAGRREEILAKMTEEIDGVVSYEVIDVNTIEAVDGLHKLIGKHRFVTILRLASIRPPRSVCRLHPYFPFSTPKRRKFGFCLVSSASFFNFANKRCAVVV